MGWFSNSTEKSALQQYPNNPDITKQYGSGAEQDRYGSHFASEQLERGINKGVDKLKAAAMTKGQGAEQDRYNAHFSPAAHGTDAHKVQEMAKSLMEKAKGSPYTSSSFGLGHDGQLRAKMLAGGNGSGAEQDNFGGHFGLDRGSVQSAAKSVEDGAKRVRDGAKDVLERR